MEYIKQFPNRAKVIASIIALLVMVIPIFTSCSASYILHRKGLHADTVEVWVKTKTNNATY